LLSYSEVEGVDGYLGNFTVTIHKKARYVDEELCTGCGICEEKCPKKVVDDVLEAGLGYRKAIYRPFPQAVPKYPVIDKENCIFFERGKCKACQIFCPAGAIDFEQEGERLQVEVGNIILATGYDLFDARRIPQYGYGRLANVFTSLEFERMVNAAGPTGGKIVLPDGVTQPETVAIIHCVGSRDKNYNEYCSKVCCMYVAKQTIAYKQRVPDGQAYVMYIDIRSQGRGYEEFVQTAMEDYDVLYLRGKASRVFQEQENGKVTVWGVDTLTGQNVEVEADLVVLATATVPASGSIGLGQTIRAAVDEHGFFSEAHPKLRPVESNTAGIYLAGAAQFPKDIPETVAQASGAASKVLGLFAQRQMVGEPVVAYVDPELCSGCGLCIPACPYEARAMHPWKPLATVNAALCQGCGACAVACPNKASKVRNFTPQQVMVMMDAYL